jgi:hypothetical protein
MDDSFRHVYCFPQLSLRVWSELRRERGSPINRDLRSCIGRAYELGLRGSHNTSGSGYHQNLMYIELRTSKSRARLVIALGLLCWRGSSAPP